MAPEDFSDSANLQEINNYTNLTVKAFTVDLPLRYRTGQPIYLQNWGDGDGHAIGFSAGTDAESTIQYNKFLTKRAAWKLMAGSDGGRQAKVTIRQGAYPLAKISFEWAMTWVEYVDYFQVQATFISGAVYYLVDFYIDVDADEIQIFDDTAAYRSIRSPIGLYENVAGWHFFKLTVDFLTGDYVEAFINEDNIDLSAYTMFSDASALHDPWDTYWKLHGDSGENPIIYLDCIAMIVEDG